jgi:HK97 family phage prohead protease
MLVRKTLNLTDVQLKMDGDTGTFEGYASVFGGVDSYGDTIIKGAFESTLRNNGKPKMFYNHDWSMPIGKWTAAKEDDHGLFVQGELTPGLGLASDVRAGMLHGTIDGLSIGGYLKKGDYDETENGRVIRKWSSLVEVSPVVFPADAAARVDLTSVKAAELDAAIAEIETIREFERFLRDAGGLSKGAATALVARAKTIFSVGDPGADDAAKFEQDLAERLQRLARSIA